MRSQRPPVLGVALALLAFGPVVAGPGSRAPAPPARATGYDYGQTLDVNDIGMALTNAGWFAYKPDFSSAGLEWPRGSGKTVIFAAGLWLGAGLETSPRVA